MTVGVEGDVTLSKQWINAYWINFYVNSLREKHILPSAPLELLINNEDTQVFKPTWVTWSAIS